MMSESAIPHEEQLARFVYHDRVRADNTIRPEAFMPPKDLQLSVTQHAAGAGTDLWVRGRLVASVVGRALHGRADLAAGQVREAQPLDAVAAPLETDPHHAHVVKWPPMEAKPLQKILAQKLAAAAVFVRAPGAA